MVGDRMSGHITALRDPSLSPHLCLQNDPLILCTVTGKEINHENLYRCRLTRKSKLTSEARHNLGEYQGPGACC